MEFLEGRDLFGSGPSKEIPCLTGEGKPTTATVGAVGCLYMDTATGALYKCTKAENGVYTWTQEAGLYYTPVVTQPSDTTMQIAFRPSVSGAPTPPPVVVELPAGSSDSGENLGLTVETISNDIEVIGVESISLDYSSIELNSGGTMMLACMVSPSNATNTAIRWESENESVATVDNGLVTAVGAGSTAITAISEDNPSARATCAVSVAAGENTVYFASLAMQDGMYKTDGSLNTGIHGHCIIPYFEGMEIHTVQSGMFEGNGYKPFFVRSKSTGALTAVAGYSSEPCSDFPKYQSTYSHFWVTLNGYSPDEVEVVVNAHKATDVGSDTVSNYKDYYKYSLAG